MPVRVATMNLHHGRGTDGLVDLARTARVLSSTRADLFALQELDRGLERSGRTDQPQVLGGLLDMPVHFEATLNRGGGEYGIAIAAHGLNDARLEALERLGDEEPRAALVAEWQGFTVIATHLSRMRAARRAQVIRLAELATESPPPVLILGDLNTGRLGLRPLAAAGFRGRGWRPTTARGLPRRIDHVFAGPGAAVLAAEVVAGGASDHHALVAEVSRTR